MANTCFLAWQLADTCCLASLVASTRASAVVAVVGVVQHSCSHWADVDAAHQGADRCRSPDDCDGRHASERVRPGGATDANHGGASRDDAHRDGANRGANRSGCDANRDATRGGVDDCHHQTSETHRHVPSNSWPKVPRGCRMCSVKENKINKDTLLYDKPSTISRGLLRLPVCCSNADAAALCQQLEVMS